MSAFVLGVIGNHAPRRRYFEVDFQGIKSIFLPLRFGGVFAEYAAKPHPDAHVGTFRR